MASGPTGRSEESTQFSLAELLKLEDERVEEQARERRAREAATARELEETARRLQAEAEAKTRAEAEALDRKRRSDLHELARREAMEKALVEQTRLEVEVRARAEERERERRHEIEIERLRSTGRKDAALGPLGLASALGGGIVLVVALGLHLGVLKPTSDRRIAELQQSLGAAEGRVDELGRRVDDQHREIGERDKRLAEVQTELEALRARKAPTPAAGAGPRRPTTAPAERPTSPQPECLKGDPLCPYVKSGH